MIKPNNQRKDRTMKTKTIKTLALAGLTAASPAPLGLADFDVNKEELNKPERNYSPGVGQNFPLRVFWGDTHLHTSYSTDAGMIGNTLGPEEAYRFARGAEVISATCLKAKLRRPLDFLVVSDHAECLGLAPFIRADNPLLLKTPLGKRWYEMTKAGKGYDAFLEWGNWDPSKGDPIKNPDMNRAAWDDEVKFAEEHNSPTPFTTFI